MAGRQASSAEPIRQVPAVALGADSLAWVRAHYIALLGLLLGGGALALYERTMARTVRWGDPGEFQLAARVLGVPHPPGYPLWVIVAHLFDQLIPFGDHLWRIGLPNVLFGAATVGLVYLIALRLGVRPLFAAAGAAFFAIAPRFWGEATEPRAYALNLVLVALILWLLLRWRASDPARRRPWLLALALAIGSAFANHATTITLLPGYALFILGVEVQTARAAGLPPLAAIRRRVPDYLLAAGAALLGLTPYLLPLARFLQGGGPYYWGDPTSWQDFFRLVSGQDFRWMVFGRPWATFGAQAAWGFNELLAQYTAWGVGLGLLGWAVLARRQPLFTLVLALGGLLSFLFAIMYDAATNVYYLIPGHLFWALALAAALNGILDFGFWILDRLLPGQKPKAKSQNGIQVIVAGVLLLLFMQGVAGRYAWAGWQRDVLARDQAEVVLREVPPGATMYVGWEASSVMKYYQLADGRRTDITLRAGNPAEWGGLMRAQLLAGQPVYVTEPPTALRSQFVLTPLGFAYKAELLPP